MNLIGKRVRLRPGSRPVNGAEGVICAIELRDYDFRMLVLEDDGTMKSVDVEYLVVVPDPDKGPYR